jgi:hypothetical protein
MKKYFLLSVLVGCLASLSLNAQSYVFEGLNIHRGLAQPSFFILVDQDEKKLIENLKEFVKPQGKFSELEKRVFRLESIKRNEISEDLQKMDMTIFVNKPMLKLAFFYLDKDGEPLKGFQFNQEAAKKYVSDFSKFNFDKLAAELAAGNLRLADEDVSEALKDVAKIEKQLESNLKDQEKLGKKLDASPEMLTKALGEKEELVGKLYSETEADKKTSDELKKASLKKEKEIAKIQKEKEKAETKLEKKEKDFDTLKDELFKAKHLLKELERVRKDATDLMKK